MMRTERHVHLVWIATLLIPTFYIGSYLALVEPHSLSFRPDNRPYPRVVSYKIQGVWVVKLYRPLNRIDRQWRRDYWEDPPVTVKDSALPKHWR
jgi:hypothetical protein